MNGIFIVFEGIDGSGKTTQVELLAAALRESGEDVVVSKEPTDGPWGKKIRASAAEGRMPLDEELEAFIRDREEHLEEKIRPALEAGKIVILDRYFYSTIAYQGARGGDFERLDREVRSFALAPDVVFILDVDAAVAVARIQRRDGVTNEFEKASDLAEIRTIYQKLSEIDPLVTRVDSSQSIALLHEHITKLLLEGVLKKKRCAKEYGCDDPVYCAFRMTGTCPWFELRKKLLDRLERQRQA